jgi:hypothetical protein
VTTSAVLTQDPRRGAALHSHADLQGSKRMGEGSSRDSGDTSVNVVPGPSCAPPSGRSSAKNKVARSLAHAFRAISPRMRCSFIDRQYSSLTGMDRSEWEIILEELIRMRFLVKKEPVSEGDD